MKQVIGIQEQEIVAGGNPNAGIASRRQTCVRLAYITDPLPVLTRNRFGIVVGSIIHDDNLNERMRLRKAALDCLAKVAPLAKAGYDDGNGNRRHERTSLARGSNALFHSRSNEIIAPTKLTT